MQINTRYLVFVIACIGDKYSSPRPRSTSKKKTARQVVARRGYGARQTAHTPHKAKSAINAPKSPDWRVAGSIHRDEFLAGA
jgi:hypothetical protein